MRAVDRRPRLLLAAAGLSIDGGIAAVARSAARAFDEETLAGRLAGSDRALLLDERADAPPPPAGGRQWLARGSQLRMAALVVRAFALRGYDFVLFDQAGLARLVLLPAPRRPARWAILCHGQELEVAARSAIRKRAMQGAWRLIANSEHTGRMLRSLFPSAASRVRVAALGIEPERIHAWSALPNLADDALREKAALIVARMWRSERGKGHDTLLDAWPRVLEKAPRSELWIVGGGDDAPRLEARARSLGRPESVRFLGRVSDEELASLYRRASLFVMPSRQEGFGLVYAEAMWHGLPCVGSTADAAAELIEPGVTGELVPWGDAEALASVLGELLANAPLCRALGAEARRRARVRFAYERYKADLLAALEL